MTATDHRPQPVPLHTEVHDVHGRSVQVLTTAPDDAPVPDVVLLPGLGLPGYLVPSVRALADRGLTSTVLDLPGFRGTGPRACEPSVTAVGTAAAAWLQARCAAGSGAPAPPVVLVGHSTGAQAALIAALASAPRSAGCSDGPVAGLVMAGPTVEPGQRGLARLATTAPRAYRRDSARELLALRDVVRWAPDVVRMLASSTRDAPEETIGRLRLPVVRTAGRADAFAPTSWLSTLARSAVRSPSARVVRLPGSHNYPYTHPVAFSAVVAALVRAVRTPAPPG